MTVRARRRPKAAPAAAMVAASAGALVAVAALVGLAGPGAAQAAAAGAPPGPTGFAGGPPALAVVDPGPDGWFEPVLAPGQQARLSVAVRNPTAQAATYRLYPADATTAAATGVAYSTAGQPLTSTGTWLGFGQSTVTLPPGGSTTVAFTVTVPPGATPGDHVAAVASDGASPETIASQGVGLTVTSRVVLAVVVHVPGPTRSSMQVGQPVLTTDDSHRPVLAVPLDDTGDVLTKPHLATVVTTCSGAPVVSVDRQLDTFVPHTSIVYDVTLAGAPLQPGCYHTDVTTDVVGPPTGGFHGTVTVAPPAGQQVAPTPAAPQVATPTTVAPTAAPPPTQPGRPETTAPPPTGTGAPVLQSAPVLRPSAPPRRSEALVALSTLVACGLAALMALLVLAWRRRRRDDDEPAPATT